MNSGVPQGYILGLLLFICYINDLPTMPNHSFTFLYADDMALLAKGKHVSNICSNLEDAFAHVNDWFGANRLSLNQSKTKCMLFCSNHYHFRNVPLNITQPDTGNTSEQTNEYKYSGIWLVPHLPFKYHVDKTFQN